MKRWIALGLVLPVIWAASAQADTAKILGDLVSKASGSLAAVQYTVESPAASS